jgi:MFS family permease
LRNDGDLWRLGALVAIEPAAAGLLSIFVSDPLQNRWLGRRGAVCLSAVVSSIATIALACSKTIPQVLGLRLLIGVSLGAKASIINPMLAEVTSEFQLRGRILSIWQIGDAAGIFCGFLSWYIINRAIPVDFPNSADRRWRILSLTPLITSVPLIFVAYTIPESYVFLLKKQKYPAAAESVLSYCRTRLEAMRLLISSHFIWETERKLMGTDATKPLSDRVGTAKESRPPGQCLHELKPGQTCTHRYHTRFAEFFLRLRDVCWADQRCRRALLSSGLLMVTQAICGINAFVGLFPSQS